MTTTGNDKDTERDEVLFSLHKESANPTAEQIVKWIERFPQYADDIRAHVAIIKDWAAREGMPVLEPDATMISRGRSRALDALYRAQSAATTEQTEATASSFDQILELRAVDVPTLSRELNISRGMLSALINGRMVPPVGARLVIALTNYLSISRDKFNAALDHAISHPALGHAKADGIPGIICHSYEDLVRGSSMTEERKRYWLGED